MLTSEAQDRPQSLEASRPQSFLVSRVREEAAAAADATSVEETIDHLELAIAYARRVGEAKGHRLELRAQSWADEHRVW